LNCTLFFFICFNVANSMDRCPHYHVWSHHLGIDLLLHDA
jgi:hypothetical protein